LGPPPHGGVDTDSVVRDGFLYAQHSSHRVSKYASRILLDETLDRETKQVWQRRHDRQYSYTVVQDDRLVRTSINTGGAALAGFDTETGRRTWAALTSEKFKSATDTEPGDLRTSAFSPRGRP
jgi:hypothetical protein